MTDLNDLFIIILSAWLLVLIHLYSPKEELMPLQLMVLFLGSIIAWVIFLWPVEYLLSNAGSKYCEIDTDKLHDMIVAVNTLVLFQLLVMANKNKLLLKIYKDKTKKYE